MFRKDRIDFNKLNTFKLHKLNRLNPNDRRSFMDAFVSFQDMYNSSMERGKVPEYVPLVMPEGMNIQREEEALKRMRDRPIFANPIQLHADILYNMCKPNQYYVSTKADGRRMMMMIGNKIKKDNNISTIPYIDNGRKVFFVDTQLNFYIVQIQTTITTMPTIYEHIDSVNPSICLYNNGATTEIIVNNYVGIGGCLFDGELLLKERQITFLAFDILYAPMKPQLSDRSLPNYLPSEKLEFKNSVSMFGFKSMGRWPTVKRRSTLEYIFEGSSSKLNNVFVHNFLKVVVSPFIKFDHLLDMFGGARGALYGSMKQTLKTTLSEAGVTGINTDGLIFTPVEGELLIGSWMGSNNYQIKWKPISDLTVDVSISRSEFNKGMFKPYVYTHGGNVEFVYKDNTGSMYPVVVNGVDIKQAFSEQEKSNIVVECTCSVERDRVSLTYVKNRDDKDRPNRDDTASSVISSYIMEQILLRHGTSVFGVVKKYQNKNYYFIPNINYSYKYLMQLLFYFPNANRAGVMVNKEKAYVMFSTVETNTIRKLINTVSNSRSTEMELECSFSLKRVSINAYTKYGFVKIPPFIRVRSGSKRYTFLTNIEEIKTKTNNIVRINNTLYMVDEKKKIEAYALGIENTFEEVYINYKDTVDIEEIKAVVVSSVSEGEEENEDTVFIDSDEDVSYTDDDTDEELEIAKPVVERYSGCKITLSNEKKFKIKGIHEGDDCINPGDVTKLCKKYASYEYQQRWINMNACKYWVIEMIEYSSSTMGFENAYLNYRASPYSTNKFKPRVRFDIEFAPYKYPKMKLDQLSLLKPTDSNYITVLNDIIGWFRLFGISKSDLDAPTLVKYYTKIINAPIDVNRAMYELNNAIAFIIFIGK